MTKKSQLDSVSALDRRASAASAWFSRNLGDAMLAGEPLGRIETLFRSAHARAGRPAEMALFVRHESEGRLHCELWAYFSPAAAVVAREVDAEPCDQPSRDGLSLLVGSEVAWWTLFPQRTPNEGAHS